MKFQGLVGGPGEGGKIRLVWLANMDFGGVVPVRFVSALLVRFMAYPITIVEHAKELKETEKATPSLPELDKESEVSGEALKEMRKKLEIMQAKLDASDEKVKEQEVQISELRRRLKREL